MFMDPKITLSGMNFQVTDTVADFGAGSGFLAFTLAQMIPSGHVFAIEINKDMVTRIAKEAEDKNITNIHPLWGDIEILGGSGLADAAVDTVVLSNVLFQLEDKKGVFAEVKRVLKPGGRVLLIDWSDSFSGLGPAPHHVFTKDQAMALLGEFGFIIKNDNLPVGDHHYAILSSI
ncbi:MAG: class I SAM-dependent methyltransferase [bacterium]